MWPPKRWEIESGHIRISSWVQGERRRRRRRERGETMVYIPGERQWHSKSFLTLDARDFPSLSMQEISPTFTSLDEMMFQGPECVHFYNINISSDYDTSQDTLFMMGCYMIPHSCELHAERLQDLYVLCL
jgi:hypothetical protein